MRTLLLLGWLMVGVGLGAYHYGPGQDQIKLEEVASALKQAEQLAQETIEVEQLQTERADCLGLHVGLEREFPGLDALPFRMGGLRQGQQCEQCNGEEPHSSASLPA